MTVKMKTADDESLFAIDDLDLGRGCEEHGDAKNAVVLPEAEPLQVGRLYR